MKINKRIFYLIIALLLGAFSLQAQTTAGTDFWLAFGRNGGATYNTVNLQIRIVSSNLSTKGRIYFTQLGTWIDFNIAAQQVYTYNLTNAQKEAVYNISTGVSNRSIHITSEESVTVYALNQFQKYTDATNVLPLAVLGINYYQISHTPFGSSSDAYAVVATEDNTKIYHDGSEMATLQKGGVYYHTSGSDMTGNHITASNPIAFFAVNQLVRIPVSSTSGDNFMQQLAPVNTWGRNFFVPVANLTAPGYPDTKNRVRIVSARNNTTFITPPTGVTLITESGGQSPLSKPLNPGEFFELEVTLNNNGCYFETDKPVGVCTYFPSMNYNNGSFSDPAQAWLPAIEQNITAARIAPFIPIGNTNLDSHTALIITKTATKGDTKVSIGGTSPVDLSGGAWRDHPASGFSFYNMPMTNETASYNFTNMEGIIVMGYGTGDMESYYYLASSSMLNLSAAFTANGFSYIEMDDHVFCEHDIAFVANIQGIDPNPGSLNWYIDGVHQTALTDQFKWSKNFPIGNYEIQMSVLFEDGSTETYEGTLKIGATITTSALPLTGGTVNGSGCYEWEGTVNLTATPNISFYFVNWTENGSVVSTNSTYSFSATKDRTVVANFSGEECVITLFANPPTYGTVSGDGIYTYGTSATVHAKPETNYEFVNWTENGAEVSTDADYVFTVMGNRTLTANFAIITHDIILSANPPEGGSVYGAGTYPYEYSLLISAIAKNGYHFVNWTEGGNVVSTNATYSFSVMDCRTLVANFEKMYYEVIALMEKEEYGYTEGSGKYEALTTVRITAVSECYRFKYWTIEGEPVSSANPYEFIVKNNATLVATFYTLDFDTYCPILWHNTFMLNLKKLRENGYNVIGCKWFKNGEEELETRTINEFSYSAGPGAFDLLEPEPTFYSFRLITNNRGELCSTPKIINSNGASPAPNNKMWVYSNPVQAGVPFTVEGVSKDDEVRVYNQYGMCVHSAVAGGESIVLTLNVQAGVYVVKAGERQVKVVVVR